MRISIHAPPRGATPGRFSLRFAIMRFQFTPLREGRLFATFQRFVCISHFNSRPSARGDLNFRTKFSTRSYFNSRPSARGDGDAAAPNAGEHAISIHAPPRGATACSRATRIELLYFNSRPSARGDGFLNAKKQPLRQFQFTPLREGRPRLSPPPRLC